MARGSWGDEFYLAEVTVGPDSMEVAEAAGVVRGLIRSTDGLVQHDGHLYVVFPGSVHGAAEGTRRLIKTLFERRLPLRVTLAGEPWPPGLAGLAAIVAEGRVRLASRARSGLTLPLGA